MYLALKLFISP